ncbi:Gene Transfer Agent FAD/FMN-containing dehydrogenase [Candidatus Rhodobacter oscarellae]|uniref:Gene Transfer Agent FAD/FMN-containing dehydrogenase n=1 Tax=Candidatus Rhodobacter oscarellae TaxID=1675527 RepID=A0A0J9E1L7_9RHOB|nr:DUF2163 domain-containing protein [Candidatus Rhodobacter lobularis]KMW56587.1 Gene Transfer Agent FAD/FMN-containing dehydrogenase [Candidatus Rhodobacter lobularis]
MAIPEAFEAHLKTGATTICRAWALTRRDGTTYGFTDHDLGFSFENISFRADTGLAARAIQQATGLAVDNTEAVGVLNDAAIREEDIHAGRFDGAEIRAWLVNWQDVNQRWLQFRGTLGEITRANGAFNAELRGLTEHLNQPQGRAYQGPCGAVLGDAGCKFDLNQAGYFFEGPVEIVEDRKLFRFAGLENYDDRWFEGGRARVLTGPAAGLIGLVKNDRLSADGRVVELWEALGDAVETGDMVRFDAGCDKRPGTCRLKFNNLLNFQGFPHIPGEDWLMAYPASGQVMDGGSLTAETSTALAG